jgi:hypothetical protein
MRKWAWLFVTVVACSGENASIVRRYTNGGDVSPTDPGGSPGGSGGGGGATPPPQSDAGSSDASGDAGPWPGSDLIILPFTPQKPASIPQCGATLTDLAQHLPSMYGTQYDIPDDCIAWAQALSIGIDSHITNYVNPYAAKGVAAGGFYLTQDRMTFVPEPAATHLSHVAPRVPANLHGASFQAELVDSVADFDTTPTFILDEWVVRTNAAAVAVELASKISTPRDGVSGALELTIYALAFGAAVEAIEPTAFSTSHELTSFLAWHADRAMTLYRTGAALAPYAAASQAALYASWKTSADAKPLRNFARRTFGSAYVTKVLEIGAAIE